MRRSSGPQPESAGAPAARSRAKICCKVLGTGWPSFQRHPGHACQEQDLANPDRCRAGEGGYPRPVDPLGIERGGRIQHGQLDLDPGATMADFVETRDAEGRQRAGENVLVHAMKDSEVAEVGEVDGCEDSL